MDKTLHRWWKRSLVAALHQRVVHWSCQSFNLGLQRARVYRLLIVCVFETSCPQVLRQVTGNSRGEKEKQTKTISDGPSIRWAFTQLRRLSVKALNIWSDFGFRFEVRISAGTSVTCALTNEGAIFSVLTPTLKKPCSGVKCGRDRSIQTPSAPPPFFFRCSILVCAERHARWTCICQCQERGRGGGAERERERESSASSKAACLVWLPESLLKKKPIAHTHIYPFIHTDNTLCSTHTHTHPSETNSNQEEQDDTLH